MDIVIRFVSICVGERRFVLSKRQIMEGEKYTKSQKIEIVQRLEKKHLLKTYKLIVKLSRLILKVVKCLSISSVIAGLICFGSETEVLGINILYGLLFSVIAAIGYFMYKHISEDLFYYTHELRRVRIWLRKH